MKRRKGKILLVWFSCLALPALWAPAGSAAKGPDAGRDHWGPGFGLLHGLRHLDLSAAQKRDVALILKEKHPEIKALIEQMREARKNLFSRIGDADYNEDAIRREAREVSLANEEMLVLRARVMHKIRNVLTAGQKARLEAMRAQFGEKMQERVGHALDDLDEWIEDHSR